MHIFFIILGFNDNKVLLNYLYIFLFCSGRDFQRYIDNDNPPVVSDMVSENIFTVSNSWTDYSPGFHSTYVSWLHLNVLAMHEFDYYVAIGENCTKNWS